MDPWVQVHMVGGLVVVGNPPQSGDPAPEPSEGMEFDSYEEAFAFYISYGRREGFRVSTKSSRRSKKDNNYVEAKLVCSRSGKKIEKPQALYRRHSLKTGCGASMHVRKREEGKKWFVYHFVREHNHDLTRENPCLFRPPARADGAVSTSVGPRVASTAAAGARRSRILAEIGQNPTQKESRYEDVARVEEDLGNGAERGQRFSLDDGDARVLIDFFTRTQKCFQMRLQLLLHG